MRSYILHISILLLAVELYGQEDNSWKLYPAPSSTSADDSATVSTKPVESDSIEPGIVEIFEDYRLKKLIDKHIAINDSMGTFPGYRLQIFSGSGAGSREEANELQAKFLTIFPNYSCYSKWDSPNWKVRIGDFKDRLQALKFKREVEKEFPYAFIVKDQVLLPDLN